MRRFRGRTGQGDTRSSAEQANQFRPYRKKVHEITIHGGVIGVGAGKRWQTQTLSWIDPVITQCHSIRLDVEVKS